MKRTSAILLLSFLILASVFCARSGAQEGGTTPNLGLQYPSRNQGLNETIINDINIIDGQFQQPVAISTSTWTSSCYNPYAPGNNPSGMIGPPMCEDTVVLNTNATIYFPQTPGQALIYVLHVGQPWTGGPFNVSWGNSITWSASGVATMGPSQGTFTNIMCNYGSSSGWNCNRLAVSY